MFIGDVEIPIVGDISDSQESEVDEIKGNNSYKYNIDSVAVKHESSVPTVTIFGFVNQKLHNQHLSIEEQKKELKKLRERGRIQNPINFKGYYGYLLIEEVDFTDNANSKIVNEVEITARYFPWPKYHTLWEPFSSSIYNGWQYGSGLYEGSGTGFGNDFPE